MKHRVKARKLNRTPSHHKAMQRNMAQSLIQHGRVETTIQKAKDLRPFFEKLVTLARGAKLGSVTARRQIHKLISDRSFVPAERQDAYDDLSLAKRRKALRAPSGRRFRTGKPKGKMAFTGESITHRLINTIAERYLNRPGGYTRLIKLAKRRIGDGGQLAVIELVGDESGPGTLARPVKSARKRRADSRYALAVKLAKQRRVGSRPADGSTTESSASTDTATESPQADE
jgi:large subunit ribosomal protein L17